MRYCNECGRELEDGEVLMDMLKSTREYKTTKFEFTWFKWGAWSIKDVWFLTSSKEWRKSHPKEEHLWTLNIGPLQIARFRC